MEFEQIHIKKKYKCQIEEYIKTLTLSDSKIISKNNTEFKTEFKTGATLGVVKKIHNHKIDNGENIYLIEFKNYKGKMWVKESETNCEITLNNYWNSRGKNTTYCFCRVSSKQQVGPSHVSIDVQAKELYSFAKTHRPNDRIKIVKVSTSAYKNIPDVLIDISESAKNNDSILVYRVDRLSRNIVKYLNWLENLKNKGVKIFSMSENISYSNNQLNFIQLIIDAQRESFNISRRVKSSLKRRRERGDECLGCLRYGKKYKRMEKNGRLIIVDDSLEKKIIQTIKDLKKKKKYSIQKIVSSLESLGLRKRGRKWTEAMVKYAIKKY